MPELFFKYRNWLFCGFMGVSGLFLFSIRSVFNGGFYLAVSRLWIPLAILVFGYTWWHRAYFVHVTKSKWSPWIHAVFLYPLILLMSWPYFMALNALTGRGKAVAYEGPVQRKWISQGKTTTYHVEILDESSRETITLNVSGADYRGISEGQTISQHFKMGGFGVPFRWTFE